MGEVLFTEGKEGNKGLTRRNEGGSFSEGGTKKESKRRESRVNYPEEREK